MRVAIFASSDSITDEMLSRLEELVESRHALVKTHIFPNRPMVWNMLKSFGIEIRLFTDKDIALIGEMRVSGNSYVEIAKYFGCSITTIRNYLKREGFLIGKL